MCPKLTLRSQSFGVNLLCGEVTGVHRHFFYVIWHIQTHNVIRKALVNYRQIENIISLSMAIFKISFPSKWNLMQLPGEQCEWTGEECIKGIGLSCQALNVWVPNNEQCGNEFKRCLWHWWKVIIRKCKGAPHTQNNYLFLEESVFLLPQLSIRNGWYSVAVDTGKIKLYSSSLFLLI